VVLKLVHDIEMRCTTCRTHFEINKSAIAWPAFQSAQPRKISAKLKKTPTKKESCIRGDRLLQGLQFRMFLLKIAQVQTGRNWYQP